MLNGNWSLLPTIPVFNRLLSEWKTNQNQINKYTAFWNHISSYEGNSHKNYSLQFFYFLLFYISFYISRYFSPAFRILFNIIWKTIFVTNLPFFNRSSQRHSHLLKNQNPLSMKEDFFDAPLVLEYPGTVFYNIQYTGVNYIYVLSLKSWKTIVKKHGLNTTSPSFVIFKYQWV